MKENDPSLDIELQCTLSTEHNKYKCCICDFAFWEWEKPPTDWHTIVFDRLDDVVNFDDISSWLNSSLTLHL